METHAIIPAAVVRALRTPRLEPSAFTPTKFHSAEDKAWFGDAFFKFVAQDYPKSAFSKRFYMRLSNCFGHIANYNLHCFYETFFLDLSGKIDFLTQTLRWPCYGDPAYTFCDVERLIQKRLATSRLLDIHKAAHAAEIDRAERATLARLKAIYEPHPEPQPTPVLRQGNLFDLSA
jgi:hypothetical protein